MDLSCISGSDITSPRSAKKVQDKMRTAIENMTGAHRAECEHPKLPASAWTKTSNYMACYGLIPNSPDMGAGGFNYIYNCFIHWWQNIIKKRITDHQPVS